jgi:TolB-like protein/cytochrome c-type biogenesis protein CcmH/NrfG
MSSVNDAQNRHLRSSGPGLKLRLLGSFHVEFAGGTIAVPSRKARALLAYLVQHRGSAVARGTLTGLLWGERGEEQARASLRQALSELRSALSTAGGVSLISATADTVSWTDGLAWTDTALVEDAASSADPGAWRDAAAALRGEFLDGLALDEPAYEQWLAAERQRLRLLSCAVLSRLMERDEKTGDLGLALEHGLRLLALDPLQERVHRALMRLYAATGRPDAALAQFERLKREFESQLGVDPETETQELARTIRAGRRSANPPAAQPAPPPPSVSDKPSIAVLPFANLSSNPEQQFFADGIAEEIIGALSRIHAIFVVSRSSSFTYKGRTIRAEEAARELGVSHVLEGSIRVAGNRVRVSAQLIDGASGGHVWAERYEGDLSDIFGVQDEITRSIALAMQVQLAHGEWARLWDGQTRNLQAWEKMVRARTAFMRYTMADNSDARRFLEEALELDPTYSGALALLGLSYYWDARYTISVDKSRFLELAEEHANRALALNPALGAAYTVKGAIALTRDLHDEAVEFCEKSISLTPSDAMASGFLAIIHVYAGNPERALVSVLASMRHSPCRETWQYYFQALAYLWLGNLDQARDLLQLCVRRDPEEPYGYAYMAIVFGFQGDHATAAATVAQLRKVAPAFSIRNIVLSERYREPDKLARLTSILRRAGLPD